jgi:hypothetical protein
MNHQKTSDTGPAHPVRAFQTDPNWYESYWYGSERSSMLAPIRHSLTMLASLIPSLRSLIVERSTRPVPKLHGTS